MPYTDEHAPDAPPIFFVRVCEDDIEIIDPGATTERAWHLRKPLRRPVLDALAKLQRRRLAARCR